MILLTYNGTNISDYLVRDTLQITEQLNNRSNVASFRISNYTVTHSSAVQIYDTIKLKWNASSGQAVITVQDVYEYYQVFNQWDELIMDYWGSPFYATIDSVDYTNGQITLTENLPVNLNDGDICAKLVFAGNVEKVVDREAERIEVE